jgi:hypothetical protein
MWNLKATVTAVIIGVTGSSSKSFRNYMSKVVGDQLIKELQQTAIVGTEHVLQKVLM